MFKFLLYLFLFYIILRFVFGNLFKVKVFHYHQYDQNKNMRNGEGNISVDHKPTGKDKKDDSQLGEYVDYEEVK